MTGAIILLGFLFVLGIGISTILYVCRGAGVMPTTKEVHNFWVMASWGLGIYLCFAFVTLLMLNDVLPVPVG